MITEDRGLTMLAEANPVPQLDLIDVDVEAAKYLATLEQRSSEVTQLDTKTPDNREKNKKNAMAFLVAAAVVIVAGIGFMVVTQGDEVPTAAPALSVVVTSYEAWNNGDYDGYLATFTVKAAEEEAGDITQVLMNANEQIELVEPCRVIETSPTGESTVQCLITDRNDWNGPAGFTDNVTETFVVNAENKISSVDSVGAECCFAKFQFNRAFWVWFQVAYPDVYEEIKPADAESLPGWRRDPSDMLIAVQYVDEFVAQSDDYPISP